MGLLWINSDFKYLLPRLLPPLPLPLSAHPQRRHPVPDQLVHDAPGRDLLHIGQPLEISGGLCPPGRPGPGRYIPPRPCTRSGRGIPPGAAGSPGRAAAASRSYCRPHGLAAQGQTAGSHPQHHAQPEQHSLPPLPAGVSTVIHADPPFGYF